MENVEYLGFLIEVVSTEAGTYEYSVFDMTGEDKPEFPMFETDDVGFISYEVAVDDAKVWIRDFLIDDDQAVEHIEKLYATKKALSGSPSVNTTGRVLQKLTVDVFGRYDCPEWARYAAVDRDGTARFHAEEPFVPTEFTGNWWCSEGNDSFILGKFDASDWKNSLIERPVFQKLTADVFDRPDCPDWANYAAVDPDNRAYWFETKPEKMKNERWLSPYGDIDKIPGEFDAGDRQNSLIERPAKALPDWCKVGEWIFANPEKLFGPAGYKKIKAINGRELIFSDGCCIWFSANIKQAHLRPYNVEEMPELVGKVIKFGPGQFSLCLRVKGLWADFLDDCDNEDDRARIISYDCDMLKYTNTIDGKPCAVLEHLNEKGEWVE